MASSFRLQPLTEVDADTTQPLELVADVTGYSTLVVQVRKPALLRELRAEPVFEPCHRTPPPSPAGSIQTLEEPVFSRAEAWQP